MVQIETWLETDIKKPINVKYLGGVLFTQDVQANKIGVKMYDGGQPVTLAGTINANIIREDGGTVPATGSIQNGNEAVVILPPAAYAYKGQIVIIIKNTDSEVTTTIGAAVGTVYESATSTAVDPGTIIPSVTALISAIETAVASIPADYSSLWTTLAPAFSSSTAYTAGQYVTYDGKVYKFTTDHAAGAWNASEVIQTNFGAEISDVKSALNVQIDAIKDAIELPLLMIDSGVVQLTEAPVINGITLESGVSYKIETIGTETPKGTIYCKLYSSGGSQLDSWSINASTTTNTRTYTPSNDYQNAYISIKVTNAAQAGTKVTISIADITSENAINKLSEETQRADDSITNLKSAITKTYPAKNILPTLFENYPDNNGIEWTVNGDGTVRAEGTATALSYQQVSMILPIGKYILNGAPTGSTTNGYRMTGYLQGDNATNITDANPEMEFESDGTTKFNVQLIVPNGTSVTSGITFKPMIRNKAVYPYDNSYLPYGMPNIVNHEAAYFGNAYGYKNMIDTIWPSLNNYNGITWQANQDGTVLVTGTASALSYISKTITLKPGKYAVTGAPSGSTSVGYNMSITPSGGSAIYIFDLEKERILDVESDTTYTIALRVPKNVVLPENGVVFKPMVRDANIYPYDDTYNDQKTIYIPETVSNIAYMLRSPWYNKKMNVIGDSIVQGVQKQAFANETAKELHLSVLRNYGIGGCCIAVTDYASQYAPVVSRWNDMDNDADIIFVHAGTNDYSQQVPLGDADSLDTSTFNGALNVIMNGLRVKYPTALVIFDSILSRYNDNSTSEELPIRTDQYRQAIEDRCNDHKFVFYDCYKYSGFDFVKDHNQSSGVYHVLSVDGLHPNAVGAKILGRKIAGFINWQ